jgi:hypothetical protein
MPDFVNHGAPTRGEQIDYPNGGFFFHIVHDGPDGHELLESGEQCECGQLGLGIIRDSDPPGRTNDFQPFFENFETVVSSGCSSIRYTMRPMTRWERIKQHFATRLSARPRWKPCIQIECPPLEERTINWTGPAHDYVPGSFARDVEEFYADPDDPGA